MTRTEAERRARELFQTWMKTRPADTYQSSIMSTEATRLVAMIADAFADTGEAEGWRPMSEHPDKPMAVEFYHGNWPIGSERYDQLKRSHGYWGTGGSGLSENAWVYEGTNHEVFEFPDMVDDHPTHWCPLPAPPTTGEG